ncbi:MAG: ABC transporter ATP-binding protein [Acidimicrobiales bacterium]
MRRAVDTDQAMAVELEGIVKRFPGVVANDGVDLAVRRGTIHALVGENGAGKSTLMKILYGMQPPDEGTMSVNGQPVAFRSPKDAINVGIGMVHQHFMLADQLTVLENIVLGDEPSQVGRIDFKEARERIQKLSSAYGLDVDPNQTVETLGVGERQRVEIIKVLFRGARILILDEPTAVLVPQEIEELFDNLRELKAQGETIVFISHKLDEVLAIADTITVLRAGRTVATVDPHDVTAGDLAELMVGSELPTPETRESTVTEEVGLEVDDVSVQGEGDRWLLEHIAFEVHRGEVVGVAGVEGNGQTELIDVVLGLQPATTGAIRLGDEDLVAVGTRARREAGIGYIPEDRHRRGLLMSSPLWENAMLGHQTQPPYAKGPWIDRAGAKRRTEEILDTYDVRAPGFAVAGYALSGGNQQKLVVGRELMAGAKVLLANHPTRGVDVGAQAAVWDHLRDARAAGLATLLVSADLEELIGLSDRLLVMLRGRIVAELDPATVTPEELGSYMTGARSGEAA